MILWSKGLGRVSLPLDLYKVEVKTEKEYITLNGIIESVWWDYAITLTVPDLIDFLGILCNTKTGSFLARGGGVFWWLTKRLLRFIPQLSGSIVKGWAANLFGRRG